ILPASAATACPTGIATQPRRPASRSTRKKRARSSTACPMASGARNTRPRRRRRSRRHSRKTGRKTIDSWLRVGQPNADLLPPESRPDQSGDPSMADDITAESAQTVAAGQLRAFIERVERLEEEKQTIADDIKEVFADAKGTGFDTKAMRVIIRLRKKDANERQEEEAILDLYMTALGMA